MRERLQKIIAARGISSRRHAEEMIAAGRVKCNGVVCKIGDLADPEFDEIIINGKPLPPAETLVYVLLNKPRGYVTTLSDEKGRKDVSQLVSECKHRIYPVGRLDMDSDGLLLMTNDGELANRMMHPKHQVKKVYRVEVKNFSQAAMDRLRRPITLDGYKLRIPELRVAEGRSDSDVACFEITIHEGRNRQVRRMCAIAGMKVVRLTRIKEGTLELGDLKQGSWRYLTKQEIAGLKNDDASAGSLAD